MKILLCTDNMQTGGAETHISLLAQGLQKKGHTVSLLSHGGRIADRLQDCGIAQYRLPMIGHSPFAFVAACRSLAGLVAQEDFDVLHAHARIPAALLRCLPHAAADSHARRFRVVTAHAAFRSSPLLARLSYWGEQTIAVSEDLRAHISDRFGVPAERIAVIPNGIDLAEFAPPQLPPPPHSVLFASRLDRDCAVGAELLCRIFSHLKRSFPALQLTVAGGGSAYSELRSAAPDGVAFAGNCTDMPALYRTHRIFVGVSRAAMEAAACGCAVILCGNEGYGGPLSPEHPEAALSNFCCRGLPLPTEKALLEDLHALLSDPTRASQTAAYGQSLICSAYSAEQMVTKTERLYEAGCSESLPFWGEVRL